MWLVDPRSIVVPGLEVEGLRECRAPIVHLHGGEPSMEDRLQSGGAIVRRPVVHWGTVPFHADR